MADRRYPSHLLASPSSFFLLGASFLSLSLSLFLFIHFKIFPLSLTWCFLPLCVRSANLFFLRLDVEKSLQSSCPRLSSCRVCIVQVRARLSMLVADLCLPASRLLPLARVLPHAPGFRRPSSSSARDCFPFVTGEILLVTDRG